MVEKKKTIIGSLILLVVILATAAGAQGFDVEPVINTEADYQQGWILFKFRLDEDHHITDLKNNFFQITLGDNDYLAITEVVFPKGTPFEDEMVFKGDFTVKVYVKSLQALKQPVKLGFEVSYQICQERPTEVCFAPSSQTVEFQLKSTFKKAEIQSGSTQQAADQGAESLSFLQRILNLINRELSKRSLLLFLLIFLGGFLMSLSPCVYPVIPIIMGYVGTRSGTSKLRGFSLSLVFVVGLALVYSILGVIAGLTGSLIGISFQNPLVVVIISGIFILMGLSLAG